LRARASGFYVDHSIWKGVDLASDGLENIAYPQATSWSLVETDAGPAEGTWTALAGWLTNALSRGHVVGWSRLESGFSQVTDLAFFGTLVWPVAWCTWVAWVG
jgi:hypothetical protein